MNGIARKDHRQRRADQHDGENPEEDRVAVHVVLSIQPFSRFAGEGGLAKRGRMRVLQRLALRCQALTPTLSRKRERELSRHR